LKFEEIEPKLLDREFLWKYLDFHKLISMMNNKSLFFNRLDCFDDPFEGITLELIATKRIADDTPNENEINPLIPVEHRNLMLQQKKDQTERFQNESQLQQKTQFVNCWFKSNRESMAMWDLYSNRDSVAICIEGRNLINYLINRIKLDPFLYKNHLFYSGAVKYLPVNPYDFFAEMEPPMYSAFVKDTSYAHELEYRLLIVSPSNMTENSPKSIELGITMNLFDTIRIIAHPKMEDWKFKNIEKLCSLFKFPKPRKSSIELK